jgi:LysR family transcriptional activator of nhaA
VLNIAFQCALDLLERLQFVAELRNLAIDAGQSTDVAFALCLRAGCSPHAYSLRPLNVFWQIDNLIDGVLYNKTRQRDPTEEWRMIPINYHQLYYFWTIAKCGSFKGGSEKLLLAVSTLSLQMTQLERAMKLRLLNRDRKGVSLTPEGQVVYERCERIFNEGEALSAMIQAGSHTVPTVLRLGVQDSISAWIALRIIDFVDELGVDIRVSVFGGLQEELQERLRKHALDVVVTNFDYSISLGPDFASRLVTKIPISFVGTLQFKRQVKRFPADISQVPLLIRTTENPIRRSVDAYLSRHKVIPKIEAEIENPLLIRLLALQGRGAAVIDTLTVNDDIKARRLVKLHEKPTGLEEHVWLLYNARPRPNRNLERALHGLAKDFRIGY